MRYKIVRFANDRKEVVERFRTIRECRSYLGGIAEVAAEKGIAYAGTSDMLVISGKNGYITYKIYKDNE